MDSEQLHIKLGISGTYWDKKPQYCVLINDTVIQEGTVVGVSDEVEYIEFDHEFTTESVSLKIQLLNKDNTDTVQSNDKTAIIKDMLLNIVSVEIDEIDLGQIPFQKSEYRPSVPINGKTDAVVNHCMNLGWNGTWSLTWTNPFYIWLLENL